MKNIMKTAFKAVDVLKALINISAIGSVLLLSGCETYKVAEFTPQENVIRISNEVPKSKDALFIQSNKWLVQNFNSAKDVIQFSDKESGVIICKMTLMYEAPKYVGYGVYTPENHAQAIIEISLKEGKAKIELKPLGGWRYLAQQNINPGPKKYTVVNGQLKEVEFKSNEEYFSYNGFTKNSALMRLTGLADNFVSYIEKDLSDF